MPTYTFHDKETGDVFDMIMTYTDRQDFLSENPQMEIVMGAPKIVTNVNSAIKTDSGMEENLQRIAEAHPNSALGNRYGDKSIKAVKTRQAVEKWRKARAKNP